MLKEKFSMLDQNQDEYYFFILLKCAGHKHQMHLSIKISLNHLVWSSFKYLEKSDYRSIRWLADRLIVKLSVRLSVVLNVGKKDILYGGFHCHCLKINTPV